MREGVVISLAAHAVVTLVVFVSVSFRQVTYLPRETYRVRLVSLAAAQPVAQVTPPAAAAPAPKEEPPKVEPKDDDLAAPVEKPKQKPADKKTKGVPRTEIAKGSDTTATASDTLASAGTPGAMFGGMSFDGGDFPYQAFVSRITQKISAAWQVPAGSVGVERFAVVYFRVHSDGNITHISVEQSSGVFLFDQSCQRAVMQAAPFPPLPREYTNEYVGIHLSFKYLPKE